MKLEIQRNAQKGDNMLIKRIKKPLRIIKGNIKFWLQRRIRGWSDDECWNVNYEFLKWINSRFKQYKKDAIKTVDLEYFTYNYKDKDYTQLQIIERIIELTDDLVDDEKYFSLEYKDFEKMEEDLNELFDLFKLVFHQMWW